MSEYDDVVVDIMRQQESARAQAIGGFDVTADDAGRAVELGRSTGQNPNVIAADVKNFDEATSVTSPRQSSARTSTLLNMRTVTPSTPSFPKTIGEP